METDPAERVKGPPGVTSDGLRHVAFRVAQLAKAQHDLPCFRTCGPAPESMSLYRITPDKLESVTGKRRITEADVKRVEAYSPANTA